MKLLRFKAFMAPFFWEFIDPDTGFKFTAPDKKTLLERIVNYRKQNELEEIAMLSAVVEHYLCSEKEHRHMCEAAPALERGWWGYYRGGIALVKNVALGKMVDQVTAEKRASQCVSCPLNKAYNKTAIQKATDDLMEAAVSGQRKQVSVHSSLGNCAACSCCLKFKVFAAGPFKLSAEERAKMEIVKCWQILESGE